MSNNEERGLNNLRIWLKAIHFAVSICKNTLPKLPPEEKWALTSQLRRSVQSIPANIAEAYGRYYYQESIRFCYIARGSIEETYSHLTLANKLDYLSHEEFTNISRELAEIQKMLNGYITYLKQSKRGANEPGSQAYVKEENDPYFANEGSNPSLIPNPKLLIPDDFENL